MPSSRRCCSSAPARSSTPCRTSRTCARWAASGKLIPITYALMWIGSLALAGIGIPGVFGFAGYYSKDMILEAAWARALARRAVRLLARRRRGVHDRVLFLAAAVHDLPRQAARRREGRWHHVHESPRSCWCRCWCSPSARSSPARSATSMPSSARAWPHFWGKSIFVLPTHDALARGAPRAGLGQAAAAGRRARRHRARLSAVHGAAGPAGAGSPRGSGALYLFCSTSGISTSSTTGSSSSRPQRSAAACGRPATAR